MRMLSAEDLQQGATKIFDLFVRVHLTKVGALCKAYEWVIWQFQVDWNNSATFISKANILFTYLTLKEETLLYIINIQKMQFTVGVN